VQHHSHLLAPLPSILKALLLVLIFLLLERVDTVLAVAVELVEGEVEEDRLFEEGRDASVDGSRKGNEDRGRGDCSEG
jgi:hypothetical protein